MGTDATRTEQTWARMLELLRDDRLSETRPAYAYCVALACVEAEHCGHDAIAVAEFGVAWGEGLRELASIGAALTRLTGIDVAVTGFDRRGGLPASTGHRDHPEIWHPGQFTNHELDDLRAELAGRADLVIGDVSGTVPAFLDGLGADRPLGAMIIDVDLHTSARDALEVLDASDPDTYLPAVPMYVDDVDALLTFNGRCGEALAIDEHNETAPMRYVEPMRIRVDRPRRRWHDKIFACHVLDHPIRNGRPPRRPLEIHLDDY